MAVPRAADQLVKKMKGDERLVSLPALRLVNIYSSVISHFSAFAGMTLIQGFSHIRSR